MPSETEAELAAAVERLRETSDFWAGIDERYLGSLGELVADIRTVLAALPQWQPIETAPQDRYVIVGGDDLCCQAHWHEDGGWYVANNDPTDAWGGPIYPTHWMELPQPPQQQKASELKAPPKRYNKGN